MKRLYIFLLFIATTIISCKKLDTRVDVIRTWDDVQRNRYRAFDFGLTPYGYIANGFTYIDNNIDAAISDEAEQTASTSQVQLFNNGSWNAVNNPDNVYINNYTGIRAVNFFLDYSKDYKILLAQDRDTASNVGAVNYHKEVADMAWLRAEALVLRSFFYFDLIKRYGDVPLVTKVLNEKEDIARSPYNDIVNYIVTGIDNAKDSLQADWKTEDVAKDGRVTKGMALALKSRVLLYAASPLNNPSNDKTKWEKAAQAALDIIKMNKYQLSSNYQNLFLGDNSVNDNEVIFALRTGQSNTMEHLNYPIATPGGQSGITPSHNLVSDYEYTGPADALHPYANRDPRLSCSIVTNESIWNGRTINISQGGADYAGNPNTSKTGYYLKKFLNPELNLLQGEVKLRNWILFRYAEILLNYAEAMNEAYGPDVDNGSGISARQAINMVRNRPGVAMPPITANSQIAMRNAIKHERRIELAFEGHRHWDLLRWKDAETVLAQPITGTKATSSGSGYAYQVFDVENRSFVAPKMYYYPIPQVEINKSKLLTGKLTQNPGW